MLHSLLREIVYCNIQTHDPHCLHMLYLIFIHMVILLTINGHDTVFEICYNMLMTQLCEKFM